MKSSPTLAPLLENFFTQRLMNQRQASPHTISSYRDTFRLLLRFAQQRLHQSPARLAFEAIDAPLIAAFLDDLEKSRGITTRSRNLRLTAIRSFFQYAAYEEPSHASQIQRVLAIPGKRHTRTLVHFLDRPEIDALLAAPDQQTWFGRRDHALLLVAVQTGLRLSELTGLQREDAALSTGAHVRCVGKGRKERCTPLTKKTVAVGCVSRPGTVPGRYSPTLVVVALARMALPTCWPNTWLSLVRLARLSGKSTSPRMF
jgi:site-specific recombinase XerD